MSTGVTIYQTLSPEHAALTIRAEERIKARTVVTVIENGRDLLEVKKAIGHGHFAQWLEQTFPFTERTAQRWMNAAERYGGRTDIMSVLNDTVLLLLAAPSTPEEVRQEIEARAAAGETITVAEVERLKREAKAAQEASARLEAERSDLLIRVTGATRREQEARDHLRLARERADADLRRAADTARAEMLAEAEQAKRDAGAAKAEAENARTALEAAVRRAREEAEQAARAKAEAFAEEAIARRRGDLAEIERRARAAEVKAERHHEAVQRLAAEIKQHQDVLARAGSAEREAPELIEAADKLMEALTDAMLILHGSEHAPLPPVARKWAMAQQMCAQMADAITAFRAPRIEEPRPSSDQERSDGPASRRTDLGDLPQNIAKVQRATALPANGTEP